MISPIQIQSFGDAVNKKMGLHKYQRRYTLLSEICFDLDIYTSSFNKLSTIPYIPKISLNVLILLYSSVTCSVHVECISVIVCCYIIINQFDYNLVASLDLVFSTTREQFISPSHLHHKTQLKHQLKGTRSLTICTNWAVSTVDISLHSA